MIKIKRAQAEDRVALLDLLRENEMDPAEPITDYLLAVYGEDLLGCIRLEEFEEVSMIRPVVVSERHRKKGIGRLLIESLPPSNKPRTVAARGDAVPFYAELGFLMTSWAHLPTHQREECGSCPDRSTCQPQPMMQRLPPICEEECRFCPDRKACQPQPTRQGLIKKQPVGKKENKR